MKEETKCEHNWQQIVMNHPSGFGVGDYLCSKCHTAISGSNNLPIKEDDTCHLEDKKVEIEEEYKNDELISVRANGIEILSPSDKTWEERCTNPKCHNVHAPSKYCLCDTKKVHENDDPEITDKDFEDMYVSLGKNETEKMERRFNIWLENRDDDFTLDIWDFRCLQDFIQQELTSATIKAKEEILRDMYKESGGMIVPDFIEKYAISLGINLEEPSK